MLAEKWNGVQLMFGTSLLASLLGQRINYRLRDIVIRMERDRFVADIFDGSGLVYTTHGYTEADALARATAWIDEQHEALAQHDLHTG